MKYFFLILGIIVLSGVLSAQSETPSATTNASAGLSTATNATALTNLLERAATQIYSDRGDFDLKTEPFVAIYTGHVRVVDPQMTMTCEVMTATLPKSGGHIDRIVAERNVVINAVDTHGEPIHATGERAVYTFKVENLVTNELIELTGDPKVETKLRSVTGDIIIWDRINNSFHGTNLHMIFLKDVSTNKPPGAIHTITP